MAEREYTAVYQKDQDWIVAWAEKSPARSDRPLGKAFPGATIDPRIDMTERVFRAIYRKGEKYILASTPDLPGAFGQGRSIEEAREDLRAAIVLMLEDVEDSAREDAVDAILQEELVVAVA